MSSEETSVPRDIDHLHQLTIRPVIHLPSPPFLAPLLQSLLVPLALPISLLYLSFCSSYLFSLPISRSSLLALPCPPLRQAASTRTYLLNARSRSSSAYKPRFPWSSRRILGFRGWDSWENIFECGPTVCTPDSDTCVATELVSSQRREQWYQTSKVYRARCSLSPPRAIVPSTSVIGRRSSQQLSPTIHHQAGLCYLLEIRFLPNWRSKFLDIFPRPERSRHGCSRKLNSGSTFHIFGDISYSRSRSPTHIQNQRHSYARTLTWIYPNWRRRCASRYSEIARVAVMNW